MLKRAEGFELLQTANLPTGYDAFSNVQPIGTMTDTIQNTGGRNGGHCLRIIPGTSSGDENSWNIQGKGFGTGVSSGSTLIFGFAVKFNTLHETGNLTFAAVKNDAGTTNNAYNLLLVLNGTYNIVPAYDGGFGAISYGAASTTVVVPGVWYYIEVKFTSNNSTGSVYVSINGTQEISLTNKDTQLTDNGVGTLVLGSNIPGSTVPSIDFDDIYIADTTGSENNDFLGPIQICRLDPSSNGNSSQFVGSDADSTDNYQLVDDAGSPNEADYVESATTGNKDTYGFTNLPSYAGTVKAVVVKVIGKKVDAGAQDLKTVARSSGTEADSSAIGLDSTTTVRFGIFETDPNTSAAWTTSAVDSAEFGIKVA